MDETFRPGKASPTMKLPVLLTVDRRNGSENLTTDTRSFDELFLAYWDLIYGLLLRMIGDPAEAEDLALETFFRLYRNPPKTGRKYNPGGWLFRVATNLGLHSIRSFQRRQNYEIIAGKNELEAASQNRPAQIFEEKEQVLNARSVLSRLDPRQAKILILRYSGLAYKDIAQILDLSPGSIGPLLLRAERKFEKVYREILKEEP